MRVFRCPKFLPLLVIGLSIWVFTAIARGETVSYINDFPAWQAAVGDYESIDFETMPDGSDSIAGTEITPEFNYTDQHVTYSVLCEGDCEEYSLIIAGNPVGGFSVRAMGDFFSSDVVTIRADLDNAYAAVGVFFPGGTTVSAYNESDELLGTATYSSGGEGFFIGFTTDEPIAYTLQTRNYDAEDCSEYVFGDDLSTLVSATPWSMLKALYR